MHLAAGAAYELHDRPTTTSNTNNDDEAMPGIQGSSEARPLLDNGDEPRERLDKAQDSNHETPTTTTTAKERAVAYGCFLVLGVS